MPACGPPATHARRGAKVFGVCVRDRVSFDTSSLVDKHMICELYQDSSVSQELPDQLATNVARSGRPAVPLHVFSSLAALPQALAACVKI